MTQPDEATAITPPSVRPENPILAASILSRFLFLWVNPLFRLRGALTEEDLFAVAPQDSAEELTARLAEAWAEEQRLFPAGPRLGRAYVRCFGWEYAACSSPLLLKSAFMLAQTQLLGGLLNSMKASVASRESFLYAFGLVTTVAGSGLCHHIYFLSAWRLGMDWRTASLGLIFDKSLRLRLDALTSISGGHVVNLCASDVERLQKLGQFIAYFVVTPAETVCVMGLLWREVGWQGMLAGLGVLLLFLLVQGRFSQMFGRLRSATAAITDERVRLTGQVISGIRVLKTLAWEAPFNASVAAVRRREVKEVVRTSWLRGLNEGMFTVTTVVVAAATFFTFHAVGGVLTPSVVFTSSLLLMILQTELAKFLPSAIESLSEVTVSMRRIQAFLELPDLLLLRGLDAGEGAAAQGAGGPGTEGGEASLVRVAEGAAAGNTPPPPPAAAYRAGAAGAGEGAGGDDDDDVAPGSIRVTNLTCRWSSGAGGHGHAGKGDTPTSPAQPGTPSTRRIAVAIATLTPQSRRRGGVPAPEADTVGAAAATTSRVPEPLNNTPGGEQDSAGNKLLQVTSARSLPAAPAPPAPVLSDVSLVVPRGALTCLVGPVGCGKSSLLMALLGELPPLHGSARIGGTSVAYVSQSPWLITGSVRENITFGLPFDTARYAAAVEACALLTDIAAFPNGSDTIIGERGVNLSGGQRARVGLARALYLDADVYLLDDPLSAVDSKVGRHIFDRAICGPQLRGKARLLVTHQLQYLRSADSIAVLAHGRMLCQGTFAQLAQAAAAASAADPATGGIARKLSATSRSRAGSVVTTLERVLSHSASNGALHAPVAPIDAALTPAPAAPAFLLPAEAGAALAEALSAVLELDGELDASGSDEGEPGAGEAAVSNGHKYAPPALAAPPAAVGAVAAPPAAVDEILEVLSVDYAVAAPSVGPPPPATGADSPAPSPVASPQPSPLQPGSLIVKEGTGTGTVGNALYQRYFASAGGAWVGGYLALLLFGGTTLFTLASVWLARWSNMPAAMQADTGTLGVYGALVGLSLIVGCWRSLAFFLCAVKASAALHDRAFARMLRAPVLFFDSNPAGRILNRFSKDVGVADDSLPLTLFDYANSCATVLGAVILVLVINPWVLLAVAPLCYGFIALRRYYLLTARPVKRLESVSRSPVYSLLGEALSGLPVIRAYGLRNVLRRRFAEAVDANTRAYFAFIVTSRWLGLRLDAICIAFLVCTTFASVAAQGQLNISPGLVGLSLSLLVSLTGTFQWAVRQNAELENQMVAIERLCEYVDLSPVEDVEIEPAGSAASGLERHHALALKGGALGGGDATHKHGPGSSAHPAPTAPCSPPPATWPSEGALDLDQVWMRYRPDLPPVLCGVSLSIPAHTKIGVVGRSGAGKSSLLLALLRLVEPERRSIASLPHRTPPSAGDAGRAANVLTAMTGEPDPEAGTAAAPAQCCGIRIDGIDIASVPLSTLRRSVMSVPQDPVLYSGSLRYNLDPFREHDDASLHAALARVCMDAFVEAHGGLDHPITEGGSNLSVGQRQLLCLARAILRRNKILLMDEATANVDLDTDLAIRLAVDTAFADATVITVAHRIATVIGADSVLVMDGGRAVQWGPPHLLLQDAGGVFAGLVRETGAQTAALLAREAEAAWRRGAAGRGKLEVGI